MGRRAQWDVISYCWGHWVVGLWALLGEGWTTSIAASLCKAVGHEGLNKVSKNYKWTSLTRLSICTGETDERAKTSLFLLKHHLFFPTGQKCKVKFAKLNYECNKVHQIKRSFQTENEITQNNLFIYYYLFIFRGGGYKSR